MRRLLAVCLVLAGGCAQVPLGRSIEQTVRVEVPGCPPARCELSNDRGRWVVGATPGTALVRTSAQPLQVSCTTATSVPGTTRLSSSQEAPSPDRTAAGALIGGSVGAAATAPAIALGGPFAFLAATVVLIGAVGGAGLAQTAGTAAQAFSYPEVVTVAMVCPSAPVEAAALQASRWGMAVRSSTAGDGAPAGSVWITALAPDGRAAGAGLRAGDLLLALDGRPLSGTLDLEDALGPASLRRTPLSLSVRRAGVDTLLVLRPEPIP
jgi:PDZ domain